MSKYYDIDLDLKLNNELLNNSLNEIGFKQEQIKPIIKYLQYLAIKLKIFHNSSINLEELSKIKKLIYNMTLLENQIFQKIRNQKKMKIDISISNIYNIIATIFEYAGTLINDSEYIIKSAILYSIAEYESNSYTIIQNIIKKDNKLLSLVNFDSTCDNSFEIIDIILISMILFFSRDFKKLDQILLRNKDFFLKDEFSKKWFCVWVKIMNFIHNGTEKEEILLLINEIDKTKTLVDSPIYIWMVNRLVLHIYTFFGNSIWILKTKLNFPDLYIQNFIENGIFELWTSQLSCIESITQFGKNNIYLMPTSAGKTLVAEIQILNHFIIKNKKILYICPTNALVNQIYYDHLRFFEKLNFNSYRFTGSYEQIYEIDQKLFLNSNFIIMTPEKFDSIWRNNYNSLLDQFSLIIFDEFQLIEDSKRGLKYELLISRLKNFIQNHNKDISLTFLSACISHTYIEPILRWLGPEKTIEINVNWKPTRLIEGFLIRKPETSKHGIYFPNLNGIIDEFPEQISPDIENHIIIILKYLFDFRPIMLFYERKDGSERIIEKIFQNRVLLGLTERNESHFNSLLDIIKIELGYNSKLIKYLKYGLAFHHSGLPERIKDIIEILIKENYIQIFSCTTTFAEGMNLPVQSIIFHSLYLYDDKKEKMQLLPYRLYRNIVGRAGRALKFSEGLVLIPEDKNRTIMNFVNNDLEPLHSCLSHIHEESSVILDENFRNNSLISDLQVDLLSFEKIELIDMNSYLSNTYYSQEKNDPNEEQKIRSYIEAQKNFILKFKFPNIEKSIFRKSGFNLVFCVNLYDYIISMNYNFKFKKYCEEKKNITNTPEFDELNRWIFRNHPELNKIDEKDYELITIWTNRVILNYSEFFKFCNNDDEIFFEKNQILNQKIRYIFPWVWSLINKIVINQDSSLEKYVKYIPYYIKFGVNSIEKLIDVIFETNKNIKINNLNISKEFIKESLG